MPSPIDSKFNTDYSNEPKNPRSADEKNNSELLIVHSVTGVIFNGLRHGKGATL